jgi:hypothetical protein
MKKQLIKVLTITVCLLLFPILIKAQPNKGKFINASIGFGISAPNDNSAPSGSGFYAQGEYVIGLTKWFGVRPYAGVIFTSASKTDDQGNPTPYKVTSNAFMLGGKFRLVAPIPYFAPYLETGVGLSIGSFETYTAETDIKKSGVIVHIPFSVGVALGKKHKLDLAFTYYFQPSVQQFSGATAIGFTFPID